MARATTYPDGRAAVAAVLTVVAGLLAVGLLVGPAVVGVTMASTDSAVSEEAHTGPVPEPGDPYFEAAANDGSWISYINPRDEYRSPYLGEGSGKLCVTLVNEAGEPVVGETVPNTTVTVPTGDTIGWHTHADPMVVDYPLTDNYERPLDADQFGTRSDLPQGDGYLDSHCIEWHGLPEDETVSYGEAEVDGEHADRIEVVGYIQQAHDTWETDVDPIEDAVPHEDAGGWTYEPDGSHGQAVVVLQLTDGGAGEIGNGQNVTDQDDDTTTDQNDDGASTEPESADADNSTVQDDDDDPAGESDDEADDVPGFGAVAAVVALSLALFVRYRR